MSLSGDAQQLSTLLRLSSEIDIVGDLTATVVNPSDLLAWAHALSEPVICAWRADASGHRYIQVTAPNHRSPVHGRITAVLSGDEHQAFWSALLSGNDLDEGQEQLLSMRTLVDGWSATWLTPE